jgi:hypothetical protein
LRCKYYDRIRVSSPGDLCKLCQTSEEIEIFLANGKPRDLATITFDRTSNSELSHLRLLRFSQAAAPSRHLEVSSLEFP